MALSQAVIERLDASEDAERLDGLHLPIVTRDQAAPFERHAPVYDLSIAAGEFSEMQIADAEHWIELPDFMRASPYLFVSRVVGESMNWRTVLKPQTNAFGYTDIVIEDEFEDLNVIGEFLSVL